MLLYVRCSQFPKRTFVVLAKPDDSIACVKAKLAHSLARVGREDQYYDLYRGTTLLKDSLTVDNSSLVDGTELTALPAVREVSQLGPAVRQEVAVLRQRRDLYYRLRFIVVMHSILCFILLFARWGWISLSMAVLPAIGYRVSSSLEPAKLLRWYIPGILTNATLNLIMVLLVVVINEDCKTLASPPDWCNGFKIIWAAVANAMMLPCTIAASIVSIRLFLNLRLRPGDIVSDLLVDQGPRRNLLRQLRKRSYRLRLSAARALYEYCGSDAQACGLVVDDGGLSTILFAARINTSSAAKASRLRAILARVLERIGRQHQHHLEMVSAGVPALLFDMCSAADASERVAAANALLRIAASPCGQNALLELHPIDTLARTLTDTKKDEATRVLFASLVMRLAASKDAAHEMDLAGVPTILLRCMREDTRHASLAQQCANAMLMLVQQLGPSWTYDLINRPEHEPGQFVYLLKSRCHLVGRCGVAIWSKASSFDKLRRHIVSVNPEVFFRVLGSNNTQDRRAAATVLADLATEAQCCKKVTAERLSKLMQATADPDAYTQAQCLRAMAFYTMHDSLKRLTSKNPAGMRHIVAALRSPHISVQKAAAASIANLTTSKEATMLLRQQQTRVVLAHLVRSEDQEVQGYAQAALSNLSHGA